MSTFLFKNHKKFGLLAITNYLILVFIILLAVFFSWLFLFVYKYLYTAVVQEMAIVNLKSQLIITKVHRVNFEELLKKSEAKQAPSVTINFEGLKNPFKSEAALPEKKK